MGSSSASELCELKRDVMLLEVSKICEENVHCLLLAIF